MLQKVTVGLVALALFPSILVFATVPEVVELELTHPAGKSPRVFTNGWIFGARAVQVTSNGEEIDLSDQVRWSGSGDFRPMVGAASRPSFNAPGPNTIELAVTVGEQVIRRKYTVEAVRPIGYAAVGDKGFSPHDAHGCPGCAHQVIGPIITGSPTVTIGGSPAARAGDNGVHSACCGPNSFTIKAGDPSVLIDGRPAARIGDATRHCGGTGTIVSSSYRMKTQVREPQSSKQETEWETGVRTDGTDDGWQQGKRVDASDRCAGPRPEFQRSLVRIRDAMERRDMEALAAAVRTIHPDCPGDAELLTRLRSAAIDISRHEADSNEVQMRSDMQHARSRRADTAAAWASALGTLEGILSEVEGATGGSGPSPSSGTSAVSPNGGGSGGSPGKQCLVDSRSTIEPHRAGVRYRYYVIESSTPGTSTKAYKILQWSGTEGFPQQTGGGQRAHGPYTTVEAARTTLDRLCPPAVRATDSLRLN